MPNYGKTKNLSVTLGGGLVYVFKSNVPDTIHTELGIVDFDFAAAPAGSFLGANSPKPPRAKKFNPTTKYDSSFCSNNKVEALKNDGWSVSTIKRRGIILAGSGKLVRTVFVLVGGVKRAWNISNDLWTKITADATGLGIEEATSNDIPELVWGCAIPYPARVRKFDSTGAGGGDVYTTFCSQAKEDSLPAGWSLVNPHIIFAAAAAPPP